MIQDKNGPKGPTINDLGGGGRMENIFFFPGECLLKFTFSWTRAPENFFSRFPLPHPQMTNGRP